MGILAYGIRFSCDLCGAQAEGEQPPPGQALVYSQLPVPDGWTNLDLLSIRVRDVFASPVSYLCPACSALTVGQLADRMKARYEETVAHANGK